MILAIDPGPEESAYIGYDANSQRISFSGQVKNDDFGRQNAAVLAPCFPGFGKRCDVVRVVEWVESFALRVGSEVFETVYWIGRFDQAFGPLERVTRKEVKLHLLGSHRGGDSDIKAALVERFGPGKEKAIGTKKHPGPLFGLKSHQFSALAIAITYAETKKGLDKTVKV